MASLDKLARRTEAIYLPGHGGLVREAPRFVQHYIRHRKAREASILHRLAKGEADIPTIVRAIYIGLDPRLTKAAGLSVLAHLEDLVARGEIVTEGVPDIGANYRLR
jgi:glyoxylase-like metal-dependent hydrolase (beta-lactamase superfamily II)